jgi:hypothetical protein
MLRFRQSLVLGHVTLLVSSLVLSTHSLWAQKPPLPDKIQARSFRQLATVPQARAYLRPAPGIPQSQNESRMRPSSFRIRHHFILIDTEAPLDVGQPAGMAELQGQADSFTGSASSPWLTSAFGNIRHPTSQSADHLEYYGHYIPWAAPIISRVTQQAKVHPHVTSVLKLFQPRF